jgi:NAD(P)-dependent dehydrogenase (short-subunit alcohol dehydrogenase family)
VYDRRAFRFKKGRRAMNRVLVVGADRGIAHAICRQLARRGDEVIAACLESGADLGDSGVRIEPEVDVTSDDSVSRLGRNLRNDGKPLQWLLHVAGVLGVDQLGSIDFADVRRQFEINTLGPLRVVQALLPSLHAGSKVGIVTSRVGSLADNGSGGMYAYRISKRAANMVALNLHHDLAKRSIAVTALHPGMVATDLTKGFTGEFITPDQAAAGLIQRMDELTPETSGGFVHANGERLPW